jgi:hypothetical protein
MRPYAYYRQLLAMIAWLISYFCDDLLRQFDFLQSDFVDGTIAQAAAK